MGEGYCRGEGFLVVAFVSILLVTIWKVANGCAVIQIFTGTVSLVDSEYSRLL